MRAVAASLCRDEDALECLWFFLAAGKRMTSSVVRRERQRPASDLIGAVAVARSLWTGPLVPAGIGSLAPEEVLRGCFTNCRLVGPVSDRRMIVTVVFFWNYKSPTYARFDLFYQTFLTSCTPNERASDNVFYSSFQFFFYLCFVF